MATADDSGGSAITRSARVLDLFAGAGGLSHGFRSASLRFLTVRAVEWDDAAAATYRRNHGDVVFVGGIHDWLRNESVPGADVVIGGPPCQGFSALGLQRVHDERNELWREYAQTVKRSQASYFVLENVGPFEKSPQYGLLRDATRRGGELQDYTFESRILNAADYGTPQLRRRCIVLGWHRDLRAPGWPVATHSRSPREGVKGWVTVRSALKGIRRRLTEAELPQREIWGLPGPFLSRELHVTRRYTDLSIARMAMIRPGGNRFDLPDELKPRCWMDYTTGAADVMGRLRWDQPSVTIRTEFFKPEKGRYLHPDEDRAISHYEGALLQGFPRDYQWIGTKLAIARQIGNAVPIPLGAALGRHLIAELDKSTNGQLASGPVAHADTA